MGAGRSGRLYRCSVLLRADLNFREFDTGEVRRISLLVVGKDEEDVGLLGHLRRYGVIPAGQQDHREAQHR
jgi:hypothetical protein